MAKVEKKKVEKPVKEVAPKKAKKTETDNKVCGRAKFIADLDKICKKDLGLEKTETLLFLAHAGTRELCIGAGDKSHLCCMLGVMLSRLPLVEQRTILTFVLSSMSPKDLELTMSNLESVVKAVSPSLRRALKKAGKGKTKCCK